MPEKPYSERTCPVCGKIFVVHYVDDWVYKRQFFNDKFILCSWKCFRIKEQEMETMRKKRGRKPGEQKENRVN